LAPGVRLAFQKQTAPHQILLDFTAFADMADCQPIDWNAIFIT
jgi:hypothetical protein